MQGTATLVLVFSFFRVRQPDLPGFARGNAHQLVVEVVIGIPAADVNRAFFLFATDNRQPVLIQLLKVRNDDVAQFGGPMDFLLRGVLFPHTLKLFFDIVIGDFEHGSGGFQAFVILDDDIGLDVHRRRELERLPLFVIHVLDGGFRDRGQTLGSAGLPITFLHHLLQNLALNRLPEPFLDQAYGNPALAKPG